MLGALHPVLALVAAAALVHPATSSAAQPPQRPDSGSFILQVGRPLHLAAGDRVGGAVIIGDSAVIDGTVTDPLLVVHGTARVSGTVGGSVVVVGGRLELAPSARIGHDVLLYRSTLTRAPDAVVGGAIHERTAGFTFSERALLLVWLSMTVAVVVAGLFFATFGAAQLADTVALLRHDTGRALLGTLALWAGLPLLAVLAMMTGIGIPLGIGIFVFLLPALWFIGYLVTGALVGVELLRLADQTRAAHRRYLPILVGLLTLQALGLVPVAGGFLAVLAGLVGSGAIAARAWETRRIPREAQSAEVS
jgi:hypothetical protein